MLPFQYSLPLRCRHISSRLANRSNSGTSDDEVARDLCDQRRQRYRSRKYGAAYSGEQDAEVPELTEESGCFCGETIEKIHTLFFDV